MKKFSVYCALVCGSLSTLVTVPTSGNSISKVKIADLFKEADVVAEVKIMSGDAEHYPMVVYKAQVLKAYKGTTARPMHQLEHFSRSVR